jgi:hypothetical protein
LIGRDPLQAPFNELVIDRLVDQRARRAGAHLALVERVQHQPLDRLVHERIVGRHHILEEDARRLTAELGRRGNQVLRSVGHDQPSGHRLAREADLGDPLVRRQRLADLRTRSVDDVHHARRDHVADHLHQLEDRPSLAGLAVLLASTPLQAPRPTLAATSADSQCRRQKPAM